MTLAQIVDAAAGGMSVAQAAKGIAPGKATRSALTLTAARWFVAEGHMDEMPAGWR